MGLPLVKVKSTGIKGTELVSSAEGRLKNGRFSSFADRFVASRRGGWYRRV